MQLCLWRQNHTKSGRVYTQGVARKIVEKNRKRKDSSLAPTDALVSPLAASTVQPALSGADSASARPLSTDSNGG